VDAEVVDGITVVLAVRERGQGEQRGPIEP
jgi:hypothetical protein